MRGCNETDGGRLFVGVQPLVAAAHELKSPLVLIRQLAMILQEDDFGSREHQEMLKQIKLTAERSLRLTSDLTRSFRLDDGLFDLEPVNPWCVCFEAARELEPLYRARRRQLKLKTKRFGRIAVANRELLRRVILGFADNALNYSEESELVEIGLITVKKQYIRVGVRDYGPSLPPDAWKKLESRLGRSNMPIGARPQSSGLGLYIAGEFAKTMCAQIGATRHRDGATFYIDLPISNQLSLL